MLSLLALAARLLLAAVFVVAGIAKLADRTGTQSAVAAFGAPAWSAATLALALPAVELAVAMLLVPASTAAAGALGALALLGVFTIAIAWNLVRGRSPDCHCFGQLHSAPASWRAVARNLVLIGVAGAVLVGALAGEPTSAVAWLADRSATELVALAVAATSLAVLAVVGGAFVSLMRSYGLVLTRLERIETALAGAGLALEADLEMPERGLAPGTPTPFFAATAVGGEEVSPQSLAETGTPTLLLFTSPHCGPCTTLMPAVAAWQREHGERLSVVVASSGSLEEIREEAARYELERVLHDDGNRLYELFQANGTPSAVVLAADGTIGSWLASGAEWIEQLVEHAVAEPETDGLPIGAEAPALELPSLDGESVSLASFHGREAMLLFWNPECGFCRSMRDDLLEWERTANGVTPRLVIVSSGDAESTRAEGFRSLVLLDAEFAAGNAFNANGTPMGVLVDRDGRIGSHLAAGADAVFALAGRE